MEPQNLSLAYPNQHTKSQEDKESEAVSLD